MSASHDRCCLVCDHPFTVGGRGNHSRDARFCSRACAGRARFRSGRISRELATADAAYIAGFVDGEGCVFAYMRRDTIAIRLQIVNTKRGVLDWIREVTNVGNVHHLKIADARHADRFDWVCNAEAAGSVLRQIRPYLRVKHAQADLALDVLSRLSDPSFKADRSWHRPTRDAMRSMNVRGALLKLQA